MRACALGSGSESNKVLHTEVHIHSDKYRQFWFHVEAQDCHISYILWMHICNYISYFSAITFNMYEKNKKTKPKPRLLVNLEILVRTSLGEKRGIELKFYIFFVFVYIFLTHVPVLIGNDLLCMIFQWKSETVFFLVCADVILKYSKLCCEMVVK